LRNQAIPSPLDRRDASAARRANLLHCENVMNYGSLISFIDNFVDRKSMPGYSFEPSAGLGELENKLHRPKCCNATLTGTTTMTFPLTDFIDRIAMTFGHLALLAALPVAAVALFAHAM
jgi:hypothetical protein